MHINTAITTELENPGKRKNPFVLDHEIYDLTALENLDKKSLLNLSVILLCMTIAMAVSQLFNYEQPVILIAVVGAFALLFFLFNRIWLLSLFIAFSFFDFTIEGLTLFKWLGVLLMIVLAIGFLFKEINIAINNRLLVIFLAIFLICCLSQLVNKAFVPFYLTKLAMLFCMMISINAFIQDKNQLKTVLLILAVAGVVAAGITIYEVILNPSLKRVSGSLGNPNNTAAIFCMLLPISALIMNQGKKLRFILQAIFFAIILLLAILISASRGALFNLIIMAAFAFLLFNWKGKLAIVALILASMIIFLTLFENYRGIERFQELKTQDELLETRAVKIRLEIATIGLMLFLENPIMGVGSGSFRSETQGMGTEYNGYLWAGIAPHNMYTQIIAELGIIGFLLFAWFYFTIFKYLFAGLMLQNSELTLISKVLIFSYSAMLISMISSGDYLKPFIYIIAGFAVVIRKLANTKSATVTIR